MRILVVDDHPLMAQAVTLALQGIAAAARVDTHGSLAPALAAAAAAEAAADPHRLCLLDLHLPDASGLQALLRLRTAAPALPVVVFSAQDDAASVVAALDAGAMGYIPKRSPPPVMMAAIRLVLSGGVYLPPQALQQVEDDAAVADAPAVVSPAEARELGLSPRHAEVLALLLKGLSNKLIARQLDIAENTVKLHVSAVLRALGVASRTQALVAAHKRGLRF